MNITVYLGANEGNDPALGQAVRELGPVDRRKRLHFGLRRVKDRADGRYRWKRVGGPVERSSAWSRSFSWTRAFSTTV